MKQMGGTNEIVVPLPPKQKNELLKLLEMFPDNNVDNVDKRWDWELLSANPNIPIEYIIMHPNLPWSWIDVCENTNLTLQTLVDFLLPRLETEETLAKIVDQRELRGDEWSYWEELSANPGIKIEEIIQTASNDLGGFDKIKWNWNWKSLVRRRDVTLEMLWQMSPIAKTGTTDVLKGLRKMLDFPKKWQEWENSCPSSNPNLTAEVVLNYPGLWKFKQVIRNPAIRPADEILSYHPQFQKWLTSRPFDNLSDHPLLPFEWVRDSPVGKLINGELYKWNWQELSANPGIPVETILANLQLPWQWEYVLSNPTITEEQVKLILSLCKFDSEHYRDRYKFKKEFICTNPNLPIEFIIACYTLPGLLSRKSTAEELNQGKLENFCDWEDFSDNPNLTLQTVLEHPDEDWNWTNISGNKFAFHESSLAEKQKRHHEQADPIMWHTLLTLKSVDSDRYSCSRLRLPKALAGLTLQYFSPLY